MSKFPLGPAICSAETLDGAQAGISHPGVLLSADRSAVTYFTRLFFFVPTNPFKDHADLRFETIPTSSCHGSVRVRSSLGVCKRSVLWDGASILLLVMCAFSSFRKKRIRDHGTLLEIRETSRRRLKFSV